MKSGYIITNGYINIKKMTFLAEYFEFLFKSKGCDVRLLSTDKLYPVINEQGEVRFSGLEEKRDFILFWDKDIMLAKLLEKAGHKLYNSAEAIQICDNKIYTHYRLAGSGIPMPRTIAAPLMFEGSHYYNEEFIVGVEKEIGYPMVIKEAYGSFGKQVYLCNCREKVKELIRKLKYKPHLFQQFISESCGRDIRIFVIGGKEAASMMRNNDNDFRANISNGGKMTCIKPPEEYVKMAVKAAKIIGLDYCGVDLLIGKDGPLLCEVNSNAHFVNIQKCSGIDVAAKFVDYILSGGVC
jgi:ribosomal protein S6--L-glutamate ligase/gamma-F420-2:alpha-L-glutamate ligase